MRPPWRPPRPPCCFAAEAQPTHPWCGRAIAAVEAGQSSAPWADEGSPTMVSIPPFHPTCTTTLSAWDRGGGSQGGIAIGDCIHFAVVRTGQGHQGGLGPCGGGAAPRSVVLLHGGWPLGLTWNGPVSPLAASHGRSQSPPPDGSGPPAAVWRGPGPALRRGGSSHVVNIGVFLTPNWSACGSVRAGGRGRPPRGAEMVSGSSLRSWQAGSWPQSS